MFLSVSFWAFCFSMRESCAFAKDLVRQHAQFFYVVLFKGVRVKLAFQCMSERFITSWFGCMAMQVRCLCLRWNPETSVLARNLRCPSPCHRHVLTFFSVSSLALNRWHNQVSASHELIWSCGNTHCASGFVMSPKVWMLTHNFRCLSQCHGCGITFSLFIC